MNEMDSFIKYKGLTMNYAELKKFEKDHATVGEILATYYGTDVGNLISVLENDVDGMLGYWANKNSIYPGELLDYIDASLDKHVDQLTDTSFYVSRYTFPTCVLCISPNIRMQFDWHIDN
jgi:hypothetical protein